MASTLEELQHMQRQAEEAAKRGKVEGDREITYRDALREAIVEEMERDPNVFLIGEDIGAYGGSYVVTRGFQEQYGRKRVIDAPIAELGIAQHQSGNPVAAVPLLRRALAWIEGDSSYAGRVRQALADAERAAR